MNYYRKMGCCPLEPVACKINKCFIIINILLPILLGAGIYYLASPEVIFVKILDKFLGISFHFSGLNINNFLFKFIRNYFLDMLWGYSFAFAVYLVMDNNTAKLKKTFYIAFGFAAIMEILQITSIVKGTFDIWDIFVEFLAVMTAVFIINKLQFRRRLT